MNRVNRKMSRKGNKACRMVRAVVSGLPSSVIGVPGKNEPEKNV